MPASRGSSHWAGDTFAKRRAGDISGLLYNSLNTSNGPQFEAINGRLNTPCGLPRLKPHQLHHLETSKSGGFRPQLHPHYEEPRIRACYLRVKRLSVAARTVSRLRFSRTAVSAGWSSPRIRRKSAKTAWQSHKGLVRRPCRMVRALRGCCAEVRVSGCPAQDACGRSGDPLVQVMAQRYVPDDLRAWRGVARVRCRQVGLRPGCGVAGEHLLVQVMARRDDQADTYAPARLLR